jgi:hypothetical protein
MLAVKLFINKNHLFEQNYLDMNEIKYNLEKFRGQRSTLFTGRPQGLQARTELKLDESDKDKTTKVVLIIPEGTTSFNPSFYLGLLFKSYEKLGIEGFHKKYSFKIDTQDEETRKTITTNLEDGERYAFNSVSHKTSLSTFINC